jgi:predicted dehydrogenase
MQPSSLLKGSPMHQPAAFSRRSFLKLAGATVSAAFVSPTIIPRHVLAAPGQAGANDRIALGMIGAGRRTHQLLGAFRGLPSLPGEVHVVAVSDVWPKKCHEWIAAFEEKVLKPKKAEVDLPRLVYEDYREMLDRTDIDAVVITTNDHWHALPAIHACQVGKDVYGEKPLSLTVTEGRAMVQATRKYKRVFQVGTQQRSYLRNRQGCELIRNGRLGKVKEVLCANYWSAKPASEHELKTEPVPEGLNWDRWCGQTALVPFSFNRYLTYENPGWQGIREYSGGLLTNWGAHGLDMVQWALGTDDTGPVEFDVAGIGENEPVIFRYANGVVVKMDSRAANLQGGGHFIGHKGEMFMNRGKFNTLPIAISKEEIGEGDVQLYKSDNHLQNWIDCIKSREKPVADVEIGHRTATICHICGIVRQLGRKLRWDPVKEVFPGDAEANSFLSRPQRKPYQLPDPV